MQFWERLFGFSPDGGTGLFETILILLPVVAAFVAARRRLDSIK
jgi:hypothetical protein